MTLAQQAAIISDVDFIGRVRQSVTSAALSIVGEAESASAVVDAKRHDLGVKVLNMHIPIDAFIQAVSSQVGDEDDQATITDVAIDGAVSAAWNDIAGVKVTD